LAADLAVCNLLQYMQFGPKRRPDRQIAALGGVLSRFQHAHRTIYQICVRRGWQPDICEVYAVPLRQRLARFKVPLRETDQDVELDLQGLLEQCYRNGRYYTIDYKVEAKPPLKGEDALWADEILRQAGRR
jgi:hypothetical protein